MFDISVDVVIVVLRCYPSDHRENMGLVHKLVPKIMALGQDQDSPFQIAVREEEEDAMRDYCRIFTEMGESYMSLIMQRSILSIDLPPVSSGTNLLMRHSLIRYQIHFS